MNQPREAPWLRPCEVSGLLGVSIYALILNQDFGVSLSIICELEGVTTQVARRQNSGVRMKTPATRLEDWVVWQRAHPFVLAAYRLTRTFPRSET